MVAVDDNPDQLRDVEQALRDRYAQHYDIVSVRSPEEALVRLEAYAQMGREVAIVLAGQGIGGMTGAGLLGAVRRLDPHVKLGLLIDWGDWGASETGRAIFEATTRGRIDGYVVRPSAAPDEQFYATISSFLLEWAEVRREAPNTIHVIGETWSGRAFELRQVLSRCAIPHSFLLAESDDARTLLAGSGQDEHLPVIILPNGTILANPSDTDIARAAGTTVEPDGDEFDLVIVGSGPAGLSAAVYGASEGLHTLLVDQGGLGGQATASSSIRNYLGFPRGVGGGSLARRAYDQAWVFGAHFAFMQEAVQLRRDHDRVVVTLSNGGHVAARAVVLATGASYRRIGVPQLEALSGAGVVYGAAASEAPAMAGLDVYVVGGANSAGQAALHLARYARRVTLLVRAASLDVGMSYYLAREVESTPTVDVRLGVEVVGGGGDGWLQHLVVRDRATNAVETIDADGLFLMIGARPHTEWLPADVERDRDGFIVTGPDLSERAVAALGRSPQPLETSLPGVLAVGDVRHGSVKRVASAVGEGSVAVQVVHRLLAARHDAGTLVPEP